MAEFARLPDLNAEELEVLVMALVDRATMLGRRMHTAPGHFAVMARWEAQVVTSLLTATHEALLSLNRGDDDDDT